jgi:tRNA threonylcarbamoyladenosine biosynthesis protein TsaB
MLDSSTNYLTVGIADEEKVIASTCYESWQTQSENMVPELQKLLKDNQISIDNISSVVVGVGPGSYTGVRIALTCAKVIALALNVPVYPVSSLRILKDDDAPSICLINARSKRSYFGVYEKNNIIEPDQIKTNDEVLEYINAHPNYVVKGDVGYLGLEKQNSDMIKQMFLLKPYLKEEENTLGLKPIYMKD